MTMLDVFTTYSAGAASARVRVFEWLDFLDLEAERHTYGDLPNATPRTIASHPARFAAAERRVRRLDTAGRAVLISREAATLSRGEVETRLLDRAAHGVYDIDDALFEDRSPQRRLMGSPGKFEAAARSADLVIAGSEYLADWASRHARDVRLIPSCVDPTKYELRSPGTAALPTIVWLGSPATEIYLVDLVEPLEEVHRRTGARLKLISGPVGHPSLAGIEHMTDRVVWTEAGAARELAASDVAIAPLTDTPFARGKCAYKILQYGAAGLPVVGSPVGANELALQRVGGSAVRSPGEWVEALVAALRLSQTEQSALLQQARSAVEQHYSFAAWATAWTDAVVRDR